MAINLRTVNIRFVTKALAPCAIFVCALFTAAAVTESASAQEDAKGKAAQEALVLKINNALEKLGYPVDTELTEFDRTSWSAVERVYDRIGEPLAERNLTESAARLVALANMETFPSFQRATKGAVAEGGEERRRVVFWGPKPEESLAIFYQRLATCHPTLLDPQEGEYLQRARDLNIEGPGFFPVHRTTTSVVGVNKALARLTRAAGQEFDGKIMTPGLTVKRKDAVLSRQLTTAYVSEGGKSHVLVSPARSPNRFDKRITCEKAAYKFPCFDDRDITFLSDGISGEKLFYSARIQHFELELVIDGPPGALDAILEDAADHAQKETIEFREDGWTYRPRVFGGVTGERLSAQVVQTVADGVGGSPGKGTSTIEECIYEDKAKKNKIVCKKDHENPSMSSTLENLKMLEPNIRWAIGIRDSEQKRKPRPASIDIVDPGFSRLHSPHDPNGLAKAPREECHSKIGGRFPICAIAAFSNLENSDQVLAKKMLNLDAKKKEDIGHGVHIAHGLFGRNHIDISVQPLISNDEITGYARSQSQFWDGDWSMPKNDIATFRDFEGFDRDAIANVYNHSYERKDREGTLIKLKPEEIRLLKYLDYLAAIGCSTQGHPTCRAFPIDVIAAGYDTGQKTPWGAIDNDCAITAALSCMGQFGFAIPVAPLAPTKGMEADDVSNWSVIKGRPTFVENEKKTIDKPYDFHESTFLWLGAPGVDIIRGDTHTHDNLDGDPDIHHGFRKRGGSSIAAGYVSALAARVISEVAINRIDVKNWLYVTATPLDRGVSGGVNLLDKTQPINVAGLINFQRALEGTPKKVNIWRRGEKSKLSVTLQEMLYYSTRLKFPEISLSYTPIAFVRETSSNEIWWLYYINRYSNECKVSRERCGLLRRVQFPLLKKAREGGCALTKKAQQKAQQNGKSLEACFENDSGSFVEIDDDVTHIIFIAQNTLDKKTDG